MSVSAESSIALQPRLDLSQIGTWYKNDHVYHHDSTVQLWVADEGKPSTLVIDMSPGHPSCAAQQTSEPPCHTG